MTSPEKNTLMQMIRNKFNAEVAEGFDLTKYTGLSYADVVECIEGQLTFDDFEVDLTAKVCKKLSH